MRNQYTPNLSAAFSLIAGAAITIGLVDAALIASLRFGAAGAFQYIPPRLWVIAPLCWLAVALLVAIPAVALSRRWGAHATLVAMLTLFFAVRLGAQSRLRMAAGAIVGIVACAVAIFIAKRWLAAPRRAAAIVATILIIAFAAAAIERVDTKQSTTTKPPARPDVVVIVLDTVSHDAIFPNGRDVDPRMPNLARLAQRGIVFDRAYTTAPWTLPSHFSAVTGLPAHDLGVDFDDQRYTRSVPTLAQRYRRDGYRTAAVLSNTFLNRGTGFERGFDSFEHAGRALDICRTVPGLLVDRYSPWFAATVCNWSAREVTDRALAHIRDDPRPLFLFLNYMDAHDPYYVAPECRERDTKSGRFRDVPPAAYRREHYANHIAAIRCIDRNLGRLFRAFQREPIVAVLSDHGEQFGEHNLVRHGNSVYDQLLHVPMLLAGPHISPRRVTEPISIAELPRLLTSPELAIAPSPVISFLAGSTATGGIEQWSILRGPWHFISRRGREELYDLQSDPHELQNRAGETQLLNEFRAELAKQRRRNDDETTRTFRSLGYVR